MPTDLTSGPGLRRFTLQRFISRGAAVLVVVVGAGVLVGWVLDVAILKSIHPDLVSMKANTAIAFLLSGISLWFANNPTGRRWHISLVRVGTFVVALIGALSLAEYILDMDFRIDQLFFSEAPGAVRTSHEGRMAPSTALGFLLFGISLLLDSRKMPRVSLLFTSAAGALAFFSLLDYVFGINTLSLITGSLTPMALHTAVAFLALGVGFLSTRVVFDSQLAVRFGFGAGFFVFLSIASASYQNNLDQIEDVMWVTYSYQVLESTESLVSDMKDVETGVRGFVITGGEEYLEPYLEKVDRIRASMNELRALTSDNPRQQRLLDLLDAPVREKISYMGKTISIRRERGLAATIAQRYNTAQGKRFMDAIRTITGDMAKEERRLLQERIGKLDLSSSKANRVMIVGYSVAILIFIAVFVALMKENKSRRKAEAETRQQKKLVDSVVEHIPLMIYVKDAKDLRFLRFNRAGEELLGYKREEIIGRNDYDFFPKEEADSFVARDREALSSDDVTDIPEEPIQTKNKGLRFLHTRKISLRNEQREPEYLLGISEDITERKSAGESLRKKTEELDQYFNNSLDLLCIADTHGYFRRLNPTWEQTLGYSLVDLEGKQFLEFVHPDDVPSTIEAVSQLSAQKEVASFLNRYRRSDGAYRWIEWRSYPDGNMIYASARDVTEQKMAEEALKALNIKLEAVNRELEAFSYSVSHDLRAPLRHVTGFVDLLQKHAGKSLDEKSTRFLETISQAALRMGALIDDLLSFSRMGRQEIQNSTVDLNAMIGEIVTELESHTKGRKVLWNVSEFPPVHGDRSMLHQVFVNLLQNAIKFTREKKEAVIDVGYEIAEGEIKVFVKDNGAGFDMEYVDKLFGVFQRLHHSDEFEGTGIGLANVRRIIHRHGGRTWAEGKVDQGATFHFTLPLNTAERNKS